MAGLTSAFSGPTVEDRMVEYRNRSHGFDYLRIALSLGVMLWHSFYLIEGTSAKFSAARYLVVLVLPMFFALSGFLVSGSLARARSLHEFLLLRVIRIVPALAVEVTLSACVIGGLLTTLPGAAYYTSDGFHEYFRNIYGNIHFLLPGVFQSNPFPFVNGSLWTIPFEFECYGALAVLWVVGLIRHRLVILGLVVGLQLWYWSKGSIQFGAIVPGRVLVIAFLAGVTLYLYRDRIVLRPWMFVIAVATAFICGLSPQTSSLTAIPAAYVVVFLGLTNPRKIPVLMDGDYSYGVYLYAFPFQQAVVLLFPAQRIWWLDFIIALAPVALFAAFSWHVIERPVLSQRKRIIAAADRLAAPLAGALRRPAFRRRGPDRPPVAAEQPRG